MNYQIAVNNRQLLHTNVLIKSPNWVKGTIVTFETGNILQIAEANQTGVDPGNRGQGSYNKSTMKKYMDQRE